MKWSNASQSNTGYGTISYVEDGKTKECEYVCIYIYI